jgi:hypothetical protein
VGVFLWARHPCRRVECFFQHSIVLPLGSRVRQRGVFLSCACLFQRRSKLTAGSCVWQRGGISASARHSHLRPSAGKGVPAPSSSDFFLFFITLKARVERYTRSVSLKYEPASEPLQISVGVHKWKTVPVGRAHGKAPHGLGERRAFLQDFEGDAPMVHMRGLDRERDLCWQPTGPSPLNHRNE